MNLNAFLGGGSGVKHFFVFPLPGEVIQFDEHIFSNGLKPPTRFESESWCCFFSDVFGLKVIIVSITR